MVRYSSILLSTISAFMGPMLGGFLYEKIGFEWAAAVQGLWALISVSSHGFVCEFSFISSHFGDACLGGSTLMVYFFVLKGLAMGLFYLWEHSKTRRRYGQLPDIFPLRRN